MKVLASYYLRIILGQKKLISIVTLLFALIFLLIAFLKKPLFRSTAVVLPPSLQDMNLSFVSSILPQGGMNPANAALALLRSRRVLEDMVDSLRLRDVYGLEKTEDILKKLRERYKVRYLRLDGIIEVEALDESPERAKEMVEFALRDVERLNNEVKVFVKRPLLKVIDPPRIPEKKAKPRRAFIVIYGVIIGCIIGVSLGLYRGTKKLTFYGLDELENLGISPILKVKLKKGKVYAPPSFYMTLIKEGKQKTLLLLKEDGYKYDELAKLIADHIKERGMNLILDPQKNAEGSGEDAILLLLPPPISESVEGLKLIGEVDLPLLVIVKGKTTYDFVNSILKSSGGKVMGGVFVEA